MEEQEEGQRSGVVLGGPGVQIWEQETERGERKGDREDTKTYEARTTGHKTKGKPLVDLTSRLQLFHSLNGHNNQFYNHT